MLFLKKRGIRRLCAIMAGAVAVTVLAALWTIWVPYRKGMVSRQLFPFIYQDFYEDEEGNKLRQNRFFGLENGDILITEATHFLGYRHGHAALVVDAAHGVTLEAFCVGTVSGFDSLDKWYFYPETRVLRLKAERKLREQIAAFARERLTGIPYRLTAGTIGEGKKDGAYRGTQCAHLIWLAYREFGYDVDGTGGWLVTPMDLLRSEWLEEVKQD